MLLDALTVVLVYARAYLLYRLLLVDVASHAFNRVYLLAALLAGPATLLLPDLAPTAVRHVIYPQQLAVWLPEITVSAEGAATSVLAGIPWYVLLYVAGVAVAAGMLVWRIRGLYALQQHSKLIPNAGREYSVHVRELGHEAAPCSWGNTVYVGHWDKLSDAEQTAILSHETAHYHLGHRYDIILASTVGVAAWCIPFVYLLARELRLVHEYQADQQSLTTHPVAGYKKILLAHQFGTSPSALALAFNFSPLNQRFAMMNRTFNLQQAWRLGLAGLALALVVVACTKEDIDDQQIAAVTEVNNAESADAAQEDFMAKIRAMEADDALTLSVDTITNSDPATGEVTVQTISTFRNKITGETVNVATYDQQTGLKEMLRGEQVYKVVDQMPHYPAPECTGTNAEVQSCAVKEMLEFIYNNISYPDAMRQAGVEGTAVISFVVGRDGELLKPEVKRSVHPDADKEVLRIVSKMPAWVPGKQGGNAVQTRFNLPVKFKLS